MVRSRSTGSRPISGHTSKGTAKATVRARSANRHKHGSSSNQGCVALSKDGAWRLFFAAQFPNNHQLDSLTHTLFALTANHIGAYTTLQVDRQQASQAVAPIAAKRNAPATPPSLSQLRRTKSHRTSHAVAAAKTTSSSCTPSRPAPPRTGSAAAVAAAAHGDRLPPVSDPVGAAVSTDAEKHLSL